MRGLAGWRALLAGWLVAGWLARDGGAAWLAGCWLAGVAQWLCSDAFSLEIAHLKWPLCARTILVGVTAPSTQSGPSRCCRRQGFVGQ